MTKQQRERALSSFPNVIALGSERVAPAGRQLCVFFDLNILVDIWKTSGKCGSSRREREKEKAIFLALLLRHSRGFASMSFQSTPYTASGTRINNR